MALQSRIYLGSDLCTFRQKLHLQVSYPLQSHRVKSIVAKGSNINTYTPIKVTNKIDLLGPGKLLVTKMQTKTVTVSESKFVSKVTNGKGIVVVLCLGLFKALCWWAKKVELNKLCSPCQTGDMVSILRGQETIVGVIEKIGFLTTTIGTLGATQVVIPTNDLTKSTIIGRLTCPYAIASVEFDLSIPRNRPDFNLLAQKTRILNIMEKMPLVTKNSSKVYATQLDNDILKVRVSCSVEIKNLDAYFQLKESILMTAYAIFRDEYDILT